MADSTPTTRDRLRETMRWLLAAYGAIGVVLVAGAQLNGIGSADGWNAVSAFGGLAIALTGVLFVLSLGTHVLTIGRISLLELAKPPEPKNRRERRRRTDLEAVLEIVHFQLDTWGYGNCEELYRDRRDAWGDMRVLHDLQYHLQNYDSLSKMVDGIEPRMRSILSRPTLLWFSRNIDNRVATRSLAEGQTGISEVNAVTDLDPRAKDRRDWVQAIVDQVQTGKEGESGPAEARSLNSATQLRTDAHKVVALSVRIGSWQWSYHKVSPPKEADEPTLAGRAATGIETVLTNTDKRTRAVSERVKVFLEVASDELVRITYERAIRRILIASIASIIGIAVFTWGVSQGNESPSKPIEVTVVGDVTP